MGMFDDSSEQALKAQRNATQQANQTLKDQYALGNDALKSSYADQAKWLGDYTGVGLSSLQKMTNGSFADQLQNDPGYQFRMKSGQNALESSAAARGNLNSGATLKALQRYGQDFGSNEYQNAYGRLSQLANMGMNASSQLSNAAGNYGQSMNQNAVGLGTALSNNYTGYGNAQGAANIAKGNQDSQLLGQAAMAAAMYFSDVRLKENIVPMSKENIEEMKQHLKAYAFNYKSNEHGKGDWVGVMAQDLEKSKLGRTLVVHDNFGNKMIDIKKVLSMFLATMAEA